MSTFTNIPLTASSPTNINGTAGASSSKNPFDDEIHPCRDSDAISEASYKKSKSRFSTATSATMCPGDEFSQQEKGGPLTRDKEPFVGANVSRWSDKQLNYIHSFQRILAYSIILGLQVAISCRDGDIGEGLACTVAFTVVIEIAMACVRSMGPMAPSGLFLYFVWLIVASSLMVAGYIVMDKRVTVMEEAVMKNILDAAGNSKENFDVKRDVARACLGMAMKKGN